MDFSLPDPDKPIPERETLINYHFAAKAETLQEIRKIDRFVLYMNVLFWAVVGVGLVFVGFAIHSGLTGFVVNGQFWTSTAAAFLSLASMSLVAAAMRSQQRQAVFAKGQFDRQVLEVMLKERERQEEHYTAQIDAAFSAIRSDAQHARELKAALPYLNSTQSGVGSASDFCAIVQQRSALRRYADELSRPFALVAEAGRKIAGDYVNDYLWQKLSREEALLLAAFSGANDIPNAPEALTKVQLPSTHVRSELLRQAEDSKRAWLAKQMKIAA